MAEAQYVRLSSRRGGERKRRMHEREEENGDEILELIDKRDGEPSLVWNSERSNEATKDRVDANDVRNEGRGEDHEESEGHHKRCRPAVFNRSAPDGKPVKGFAHWPADDYCPPNGT